MSTALLAIYVSVGNNARKTVMAFNTGNYKEYYWFESHEINLNSLIRKTPELLIGKYLIITHFDGGNFVPNENEVNIGWENENGITYADKVTKRILKMNIYDNYDQWILMAEKIKINKISDFVNHDYFSLIDWKNENKNLKNVDDSNFINQFENERKILKEKFWNEIEKIKLTTFISDGAKFIYVTDNQSEIIKLESTVANKVLWLKTSKNSLISH
jgi:hypothetical protein